MPYNGAIVGAAVIDGACAMVSSRPLTQALNIAIVCLCLCAALYLYYLFTEQRRLDAKLTAVASQLLSAQRATQAQVDALSKSIAPVVGGLAGGGGGDAAAMSTLMASLPMLFACGGGGPQSGDHYCSVLQEEDEDDDEEDEDDDDDDAEYEDDDDDDDEDEEEDDDKDEEEDGKAAAEDDVKAAAEDDVKAAAEDDTVDGDGKVDGDVVTEEVPQDAQIGVSEVVIEVGPSDMSTNVETSSAAPPVVDLATMKVDELRTMLRDLGGDTKGTKAVLHERLADMLHNKSKTHESHECNESHESHESPAVDGPAEVVEH